MTRGQADQPGPQTRYTRSGGVAIAYQVIGEGPVDLLLAPGFPSHLEHGWEQPRFAHFYRRLASFARLILFDKRGVGLSDRVAEADLPGIEERMDDIRSVLDAVGSDEAALIGISDGGPVAAVFAAAHPERVTHLVLVNSYARRRPLRALHRGRAAPARRRHQGRGPHQRGGGLRRRRPRPGRPRRIPHDGAGR